MQHDPTVLRVDVARHTIYRESIVLTRFSEGRADVYGQTTPEAQSVVLDGLLEGNNLSVQLVGGGTTEKSVMFASTDEQAAILFMDEYGQMSKATIRSPEFSDFIKGYFQFRARFAADGRRLIIEVYSTIDGGSDPITYLTTPVITEQGDLNGLIGVSLQDTSVEVGQGD